MRGKPLLGRQPILRRHATASWQIARRGPPAGLIKSNHRQFCPRETFANLRLLTLFEASPRTLARHRRVTPLSSSSPTAGLKSALRLISQLSGSEFSICSRNVDLSNRFQRRGLKMIEKESIMDRVEGMFFSFFHFFFFFSYAFCKIASYYD